MTNRDSLIIFVLVFILSFPVIGYSLTSLSQTNEVADTSVSLESLAASGIILREGNSSTIIYNADWIEFNIPSNGIYRIKWYQNLLIGDYFNIQARHNFFDRILGTWMFPNAVKLATVDRKTIDYLHNVTIVNNFNVDYNFTHFKMVDEGLDLFIIYNATISSSINDAVYNDGNLIATIALTFTYDEGQEFNWWLISNWYLGLLIGDTSYGLPPIFTWIIRIITAICLIASIWFARDLLPF
jgi:hypothetical protein